MGCLLQPRETSPRYPLHRRSINLHYHITVMPVPVAARLLRMWVGIPPGAWMFVCCECCVLSGRGLCDGLITRPEESYRPWCVVVCDLEKPQVWGGCKRHRKKNITVIVPDNNLKSQLRKWLSALHACLGLCTDTYFLTGMEVKEQLWTDHHNDATHYTCSSLIHIGGP